MAGQTSHPRKMSVARVGAFSDDSQIKDVTSRVNAMTASATGTDVLFFGALVALETDGTVKRLDAQADKLAGIAVLSDALDIPTELGAGEDAAGAPTGNLGGSPGYKSGSVVGLAQRGRMWVMLDAPVNAGDPVRYYAKAVSGKRQGAFITADPTGTDTVLITAGAKFVTGGTVATGAELEFDILNMTFTADS